MKTKIIITALLTIATLNPARANDAWIKVDANGNAIGGVIACSQDVCGDSNSVYSKLTLEPGERYVLQFKANPVTGNVAGVPATQSDVKLQVNLETNQWTKTVTESLPVTTKGTINQETKIMRNVERTETWNPTVPSEQTPVNIDAPKPVLMVPAAQELEKPIAQEPVYEWTYLWWDWFSWERWLNELLVWIGNLNGEVNK